MSKPHTTETVINGITFTHYWGTKKQHEEFLQLMRKPVSVKATAKDAIRCSCKNVEAKDCSC